MSEKSRDPHGRWRNVTVAFRVSPEEGELLNSLVNMSGLTKQDYITSRLCDRSITVVPSSRVQRALTRECLLVYQELTRIRDASNMPPELEARIFMLADVLASLGADIGEKSGVTKNDSAIRALRRSEGKSKPETGHTDQSTTSSPTSEDYKPRQTRRSC